MSEIIETTDSPTETESADKRERRTFPIRLFSQDAGGAWSTVKDVEFATIDSAERWIVREGREGAAYMMARVIGAKRRPFARLEDVPF